MVLPDYIHWNAPDGDHPARRASQRSYAAAGAGDLEQWLAAYDEDAIIEDPVGPSFFDPEGVGHRGHDAIRRFWAAAIEPLAAMEFTITDSHACGDSCANVGAITTTFPDGTTGTVDLVMVYTVNEAGLVTSMRAYWETERALANLRPS